MDDHIKRVEDYFKNLQTEICQGLAEEDGGRSFITDTWQRDEDPNHPMALKGYGITRVLEKGAVIEKGGVNFSFVQGENLPPSATAKRPELAGASFTALGVSLVIHPDNPFIPTSHANVRLFVAQKADGNQAWWFGGGFDLTPYYVDEADILHWHQTAKAACDPFGEGVYEKYKRWCDEYFYLKHRGETRGVGGLFFDDLNQETTGWDFDQSFAFVRTIGDAYLKAYRPIMAKNKNKSFNEHHKQFQKFRRGRYVEFNLVYDRGTIFGLQTGGRTESILMSLPPEVNWAYQWQPAPDSEEARLYAYLKPRDWLKELA